VPGVLRSTVRARAGAEKAVIYFREGRDLPSLAEIGTAFVPLAASSFARRIAVNAL